jgi:hypothetical protein
MTYHSYGPTQTGDLFDDLQTQLEKQCPQSSSYQSMVARADELERTWNPTGNYTWQDMSNVVAATAQLAGQASSAAITFFSGNSLPSAKDKVRAAANHYNSIAKRSLDYVEAWKAARVANKPVAAPGFKRWVIDDLRAAAELFRAVEVAACTQPWWVGAAAAYGKFFNTVIDVAKRVGKAALNIAGGVIDTVERTGEIVAFLLKWTPYLALGVGGYLAYNKFVRK